MTVKSPPPLSVRFGAPRLEKIAAYAEERKLKRHAAILEIVDTGLGDKPKEKPKEKIT